MKRNRSLVILVVAIVLGLASILFPVSSQVSPAQAAITWTRYSGNPVLEEDSGEWDEGGVGAACVIRDGSTYKMWYTGLHVGPWPEIGYATSSDGKSWTKYGANPVLTKGTSGTWDDEGVGSCCVLWDADDSLYKMWYTGTPGSDGSAIPAIGYATSSNGIAWTKSGSNPVLSAGTSGEWDDAGVLSPCVIKESATSYKMWYSGRAADSVLGSLQIGYATSTDGVNWVKYGTAPVLAKGSRPDWDWRGVGVGCVVEISGTYNMWFTGYKGYDEAEIEVAIGYASSSNGISWSNRSRVLTEGTGWEVNGVGAPWVTYSGGTYRMWYSGLDTNFDPTLGYAYYTKPSPYEPSPRDTRPPRISNVLVFNITKTSADISWTTNERSDSQVEYWSSSTELTPLDERRVLEHLVHLTDLTPATTCDFEVMSRDKAGNLAVSDEYTFTTLGQPATFTTTDLTVTPDEVDIGANVTISVSVANTGDLAGSHRVTLKIDNVVVSTKYVALAGGARQKVTFTTSKDVDGTYTVNVDGLAGTFVVKAAPLPLLPPSPSPAPPAPLPPLPTPINWWLIGGIIAAVIIIGVVVSLVVIRRRA